MTKLYAQAAHEPFKTKESSYNTVQPVNAEYTTACLLSNSGLTNWNACFKSVLIMWTVMYTVHQEVKRGCCSHHND